MRAWIWLFLLLAAPAIAAQPPPINSYASGAVSNLTTAGDMYCVQGSDTKVVNITAFNISAVSTGASVEVMSLVRRSSPDVGASNTVNATPYDTTSPPATAVTKIFNTAPTVGTFVGIVRYNQLLVGNNSGTTAFITHRFQWDYNHPMILRSSSEFLCLNLGTAIGTGANITISHEHTEFPLP